jgi:hypothetical protein
MCHTRSITACNRHAGRRAVKLIAGDHSPGQQDAPNGKTGLLAGFDFELSTGNFAAKAAGAVPQPVTGGGDRTSNVRLSLTATSR